MKSINLYSIEELCNEHKQIIIKTQEGVQISISVEHGMTFVLLPFGNKTTSPEEYGKMSTGIAVIPK